MEELASTRACRILATPILAEPPAEDIRNAMCLLYPLLLRLPKEDAEAAHAAIQRLWRAVHALEARQL